MDLRGVDVSAWQHNDRDHPQISWELVREDGYKFVYVKATQGTGWVNPWLESDVTLAQEAGLLVGCYHYAYPRPGGAEAEATYALKNTDRFDLDLGVALQVGTLGEMTSYYELQPYAQTFLGMVAAEHDDAPLYADEWTLQQIGGIQPGYKVWLALKSDEEPAPPAMGALPWCYQFPATHVRGIAVPANVDQMVSAGGLNPPGDARAPQPVPAAEVEAEAEEETTAE